MDKRRERIERFKSNAEFQRKQGDLQGCLEFRELAGELEKLQKIEEIIEGYKTDNPKEPMYETEDYMNSIIEVLEQE